MQTEVSVILSVLAALGGIGIGIAVARKWLKVQTAELDERTRIQNEAYRLETNRLKEERKIAIAELDRDILNHMNQLEKTVETETAVVETVIETAKDRARESLSAYIDSLEFSYTETEAEFDGKIASLKSELDKMMATRAATIQAVLREKEIQEQGEFFKITVLPADLEDINILEEVKPRLRHPEVLSKVIWTTYYQKQTTVLCNNVIGEGVSSGIYKITDSVTGLAYVGQSVDIAKRWKDHVKAALGASGTAANNKLYTAMRESGVHNFTFEVLEVVPAAQLNEKEKYYIGLYQTNVYGLNGNRGNL